MSDIEGSLDLMAIRGQPKPQLCEEGSGSLFTSSSEGHSALGLNLLGTLIQITARRTCGEDYIVKISTQIKCLPMGLRLGSR